MNIRKENIKLIYSTFYNTPVGKIKLFGDEEYLIGAHYGEKDYKDVLGNLTEVYLEAPRHIKSLNEAISWLDRYFNNERPSPGEIKMKVRGSDFQREIWQLLQEIPYGHTVSYGHIADIMAQKRGIKKMSARAVGSAIGKNPISIIIPCHRVIGGDGRLVGYGGGIDIKRTLLTHEGSYHL